jgi:hypothetical protein
MDYEQTPLEEDLDHHCNPVVTTLLSYDGKLIQIKGTLLEEKKNAIKIDITSEQRPFIPKGEIKEVVEHVVRDVIVALEKWMRKNS